MFYPLGIMWQLFGLFISLEYSEEICFLMVTSTQPNSSSFSDTPTCQAAEKALRLPSLLRPSAFLPVDVETSVLRKEAGASLCLLPKCGSEWGHIISGIDQQHPHFLSPPHSHAWPSSGGMWDCWPLDWREDPHRVQGEGGAVMGNDPQAFPGRAPRQRRMSCYPRDPGMSRATSWEVSSVLHFTNKLTWFFLFYSKMCLLYISHHGMKSTYRGITSQEDPRCLSYGACVLCMAAGDSQM